jgi:hypothetical protein
VKVSVFTPEVVGTDRCGTKPQPATNSGREMAPEPTKKLRLLTSMCGSPSKFSVVKGQPAFLLRCGRGYLMNHGKRQPVILM